MRWSIIKKTANPTIESYGFKDARVKDFLRDEGGLRCVYCAVHENAVGGVRAFHVEHYKPKSRFPELANDLSNLFYSCPICNCFKSNDWPAEPHKLFKNSSYPNPSKVDYSELFNIDEETGLVSSNYVASNYMIEKLYFNRPQLILERRQYFLDKEFKTIIKKTEDLMNKLTEKIDEESVKHLKQLLSLSTRASVLLLDLKEIPAYEIDDVKRKKS